MVWHWRWGEGLEALQALDVGDHRLVQLADGTDDGMGARRARAAIRHADHGMPEFFFIVVSERQHFLLKPDMFQNVVAEGTVAKVRFQFLLPHVVARPVVIEREGVAVDVRVRNVSVELIGLN